MSRIPSYPDVESREEVLAPPGRLRGVPGVIRRNPLLAVGAAMCIAIFLVAVLAPLIARLTLPGGRVALSGILDAQADEVRAAYAAMFIMGETAHDEGWALLSGVRNGEA